MYDINCGKNQLNRYLRARTSRTRACRDSRTRRTAIITPSLTSSVKHIIAIIKTISTISFLLAGLSGGPVAGCSLMVLLYNRTYVRVNRKGAFRKILSPRVRLRKAHKGTQRGRPTRDGPFGFVEKPRFFNEKEKRGYSCTLHTNILTGMNSFFSENTGILSRKMQF